MAIAQLVATGHNDKYLDCIKYERAVAYTYKSIIMKYDNELCYSMTTSTELENESADEIIICGLLFKMKDGEKHITESLALSYLSNMHMQISYMNVVMLEVPLVFLAKLGKIACGSTSFNITIPSTYLCGRLKTLSTKFATIGVMVTTNEKKPFESIMCISKWYVYDNAQRKELAMPVETYQIQQIESMFVNSRVQSCKFTMFLPFYLRSKGLFIEGEIEKIKHITCMLNAFVRFDYNSDMLSFCSKRIADGLIYLPFDDDFSFEDTSQKSYANSVHFGRFDNVSLKITSSEPSLCINIHSIGVNWYKINAKGDNQELLLLAHVSSPFVQPNIQN